MGYFSYNLTDFTMNILDLLDRPIAYHRVFAHLTGSVQAALMLSQAVYWQARCTGEDGWWWKTAEDWQDETGLTRFEQDTARRTLRQLPFWREQRRGMPAKMYYSLDDTTLRNFLENFSLRENRKQDWGKTANMIEEIQQTSLRKTLNHLKEHRLHTEITTETTPLPLGGGGCGDDFKQLIYPACLSERARHDSAVKKLAGLRAEAAQALLDAVAWQAGHGGFKTRSGGPGNPLRFLDYLRREFEAGRFDDSGALEIQEKRRPPQPPQPAKPRGGVPEEFRKFGHKTKREVKQ